MQTMLDKDFVQEFTSTHNMVKVIYNWRDTENMLHKFPSIVYPIVSQVIPTLTRVNVEA